ncbi:hypothetical protein [Streptomyces lydicus]|uniref:hypothetical protein n=1 Tax=Streptomyces lydicus TaxID=47763 RepID=UPI0036E7F592
MSKKLDTGVITNELEDSAFFPKRAASPSSINSLDVQAKHNLPVRPNERLPVREGSKRIITRNSFEAYEDQMDSLREIAYLEKRAGKVGSMSAMVREAIDDFLVKKKFTLNK